MIRRISRKQKQRTIYILCLQRRIYLMFTFSERHMTVCHYNDKRHVTVFRPIQRSSPYDNSNCHVKLKLWRLIGRL